MLLARLSVAAAVAALALSPVSASGQSGECRVVEVHFNPTDDLQIVVWIEDAAGNYVDTAFITRATGTYGIGNRPGMFEFNSGYRWPYGRRQSTFPVWAHRHGLTWPLVVFQNWQEGDPLVYTVEEDVVRTSPEENLSHKISESSPDSYYCRPRIPSEPSWDSVSCATTPAVYTDKGRNHDTLLSRYPPRSDHAYNESSDSVDVSGFSSSNPFDRVSLATPAGGEPYGVFWAIPQSLPNGNYVAWIEVSKEQDQNEFYDEVPYTELDLQWGQYGVPYLGQPSVVYTVPFVIGDEALATSVTTDYVGYGDPDGLDGTLREPDATITSDVPGSGSSRLVLTSDDGQMYRVKVFTRIENDSIAPGAISELRVTNEEAFSASLTFVSSGDDGLEGAARSYEVRYIAGATLTDANWESATIASTSIEPVASGLQIDVTIPDLVPSTRYSVGVRALDECLNASPLVTTEVITKAPRGGSVDACFIATAAHGSALAGEVVTLRHFRDTYLESNALGSLAVTAYYTFGPPLAAAIAPSQLLRELTRSALEPVVALARWSLFP